MKQNYTRLLAIIFICLALIILIIQRQRENRQNRGIQFTPVNGAQTNAKLQQLNDTLVEDTLLNERR